ncbi:MAG: hypothetical protein HUJ66_07170 [Oscillospiraceae bacterium]|nr:hypothetical protein [Oscillospiraceae bacterium]
MNGLLSLLIPIALFVVAKMAKENKQTGGSADEKPEPSPARPARTAPTAKPAKQARPKTAASSPRKPARPAPQPEETRRKYYDSTCMEQSTQHDHDRRMEQLDSFLKDGIIDRTEYRILKAKYEQRR